MAKINFNFMEWYGVKYVNTTPHAINFLDRDTGEEFEVPPCGILINARPIEVEVGNQNGIKFVRTAFEADEASLAELDAIEAAVPEPRVIIGSIIAAQAYPGRVVAMTPTPGYERVAPAEKRMNPYKFIVY